MEGVLVVWGWSPLFLLNYVIVYFSNIIVIINFVHCYCNMIIILIAGCNHFPTADTVDKTPYRTPSFQTLANLGFFSCGKAKMAEEEYSWLLLKLLVPFDLNQ